ncbi:MAG: epoxyqueuosine reductase [Chloroflexi bacterium]|nr:epoxyqueuosine reductase [Chloroflexota bacterium]
MTAEDRALGVELEGLLLRRGAALVGFADLAEIPPEARKGFPRAVSIAVALDPAVVAGIRHGPTRAYLQEYHRANALLGNLAQAAADALRARGFRAAFGAATVAGVEFGHYDTPLPHKTVATRAGLGWIGRCALLITERYGSAVRLITVLTDAPLNPAAPVDASRCGACTACVEACPGGAIAGGLWRAGLPREALVDPDACYRTTRQFAPAIGAEPSIGICGACIAACPWTQRYVHATCSGAQGEG